MLKKKTVLALVAVVAAFILASAAFAAPSPIAGPTAVVNPTNSSSNNSVTKTAASKNVPTASDPWAALLNPLRNYLVRVGPGHAYEFGGTYDKALEDDLIAFEDNVYSKIGYVEKATYFAYTFLVSDLARQGITIGLFGPNAGYRSNAAQNALYESGEEDILPGYSEHHTGLLLSIVILDPEAEAETAETRWYSPTLNFRESYPEIITALTETLPKYGFIVRYPEGKEEATGHPATYGEIRFVGTSEVAKAITDGGYCLEEYKTLKHKKVTTD